MQNFAMWSGVAGIVVSLFAVIILFLTRKNILDILDKDVILFDKNFELKKQAIENAMSIVDQLENQTTIRNNPEFKARAKKCYNELLCVVTNLKIANEFYSITLGEEQISSMRLVQFKIACRKDIGLNTKHTGCIKQNTQSEQTFKPTQPVTPVRPIAEPNIQPAQPVLQEREISSNETQNRQFENVSTETEFEAGVPSAPTMQQRMVNQNPTVTNPVRPATPVRRVPTEARPIQTATRPAVRRPVPPKNEE